MDYDLISKISLEELKNYLRICGLEWRSMVEKTS